MLKWRLIQNLCGKRFHEKEAKVLFAKNAKDFSNKTTRLVHKPLPLGVGTMLYPSVSRLMGIWNYGFR